MKKFLGTVVACLVLAACGYSQGPAGRVTDHDTQTVPVYHSGSCSGIKRRVCTPGWTQITTEHHLTTTRRFTVSDHDYNHCPVGSAYPACTKK